MKTLRHVVEDGDLRHVVEERPSLEMARSGKFSSEEMNSARGLEFATWACEIAEANYGKAWQPEFTLPYGPGTRRWS